MQNTLDYIDAEIARLDAEELISYNRHEIDSVFEISRMKILLNRVREVANADKVAQDKLDFERRCESC